MRLPEYVIDGARFDSLETFFDEVSHVLIPGSVWGRNLDAFNDILRGGFGTPEGGFTLRWCKSAISKRTLGYPETVRQLGIRLRQCHPDNRNYVRQDLRNAQASTGPTVFDWLVEIIRRHSSGGTEAEDNVVLVLD